MTFHQQTKFINQPISDKIREIPDLLCCFFFRFALQGNHVAQLVCDASSGCACAKNHDALVRYFALGSPYTSFDSGLRNATGTLNII
jgi:1,4-dihydroxy-2-naphthoyl-CoA synthase